MSINLYEIYTKLTMTSNVSGIFAVIAKDALKLEGSIGRLQAALTTLNKTSIAVGGGLMIAGGVAGLAIMNKMVESGEKLVHVKQQLLDADVKGVELAEATAKAWELSRKYGLDVAHVLADIKEARMVFGSTEHATNFADPLERMRIVINSVSEGSGDRLKDAVYDMAKAGELKGLKTPEDFVSYFDQMTKAISASGGKVDPKAFFQATKYGRLASAGFNEEFYTRYLPSIIQEMGPSGAGTALMSLFNQGAMGHISKRGTEAWLADDLIVDQSKLIKGPAGKLFGGWQYGAVKGSDDLIHNPFKWSQEVLLPMLQKKFGEEKVASMSPEVIGELGNLFGNRTAAQMASLLSLQGKRLGKDSSLIGKAHGLDFAEELLAHDPTAVMNRFTSSWTNFLTAFSEPLVGPKLEMMNKLSDALSGMAKWAVDNPGAVEALGKGLFALSVGLTAVGAVAVMGVLASLVGPGGFLFGLAAVGATLAAINWNSIISGLTGFGDTIKRFIDSLTGHNTGAAGTGTPPIYSDQDPHLLRPESYHPSSTAPSPQPIHVHFHVDGQEVEQAVTQIQARNAEFPSRAPYADTYASWTPPDSNLAWG